MSLDLISVIYFILSMASFDLYPVLFYALELAVVGYLYIEAQKIYKILGFISVPVFYEYKYKILDMMINLIITAHFFVSILLFSHSFCMRPPGATARRLGSRASASNMKTT